MRTNVNPDLILDLPDSEKPVLSRIHLFLSALRRAGKELPGVLYVNPTDYMDVMQAQALPEYRTNDKGEVTEPLFYVYHDFEVRIVPRYMTDYVFGDSK